jgi:hypothetical protein
MEILARNYPIRAYPQKSAVSFFLPVPVICGKVL